MYGNYLTNKRCLMCINFLNAKKLLNLTTVLFLFLLARTTCAGQCNFTTDPNYLNCSKQIYSPNFSEPVIVVDNYYDRSQIKPHIYYEFTNGTYSINTEGSFENTDISNIKINYRYTSGTKPTHRGFVGTSNNRLSRTTATSGAFRTEINGFGLDFSNPYYDLFWNANEHVVIIKIPAKQKGSKLVIDLNENTTYKVLIAQELRDYSGKSITQQDDVIGYVINNNEAHLLFLQVITNNFVDKEGLPNVLNVVAKLNGKLNISMPLELSKTGDPRDPNMIEVDKTCITPKELNGDILTYKVHFENEGNADAVNVYVEVKLPYGVYPFNNGNIISNTNFGSANVSVVQLSNYNFLYSIKGIKLPGLGDPKLSNKEKAKANFTFQTKTSTLITGNQFGAYAKIVFEGKNQINGAPPIDPVRTNDAVTSICAKCLKLVSEKIPNYDLPFKFDNDLLIKPNKDLEIKPAPKKSNKKGG